MSRRYVTARATAMVALALLILLALIACGGESAPAGLPTPTGVAEQTAAAPTQPAHPTPTAAAEPSATAPMEHTHLTPTLTNEPAQKPSTGTETPASGEGTKETIRIVDPWARAAMQMGGTSTSAVYLVIRNEGKEADRLLGAESDAAQTVELHQSKMEGGTMKMEPVEAIDIPPGGQVELKPGGLHIMLIGLKRDLPAGERLTLVLHFEHAGDIEVEAEVRQP